MVKTIGKYELHRTLGEGSFGKVKYAVDKEKGDAVAIKILDKEVLRKKNMSVQIKREISLMRMISHPHVIAIKEVFATATNIFIVLELVEGGELFDKIVEAGKFDEVKSRFYFKQLLDGIECCHMKGICHRDLKPENLLLDKEGNVKISDFGMATLYVGDADASGEQRAELLHTTCGTPNYVAPEVLTSQGYDGCRADIWSVGVILYVFLAGYLPFEEGTTAALFKKIKTADFEYPHWFSASACDLISKILVVDPADRLTIDEIRSHRWTIAEGNEAPAPSSPKKAGIDVDAVALSIPSVRSGSGDGNGNMGSSRDSSRAENGRLSDPPSQVITSKNPGHHGVNEVVAQSAPPILVQQPQRIPNDAAPIPGEGGCKCIIS